MTSGQHKQSSFNKKRRLVSSNYVAAKVSNQQSSRIIANIPSLDSLKQDTVMYGLGESV